MKLIMACVLMLAICSPVLALPLEIKGVYEIETGDILVPGSIDDTIDYHHTLRVDRSFDLGKVKLIPFVEGEMYAQEVGDGLLLTVYSIGGEVEWNNLTFGIKEQIYDWANSQDEETREILYGRVEF